MLYFLPIMAINTQQNIISPVNIEVRKKLDIRSGDTVRVSQRIQEKGKTRLQIFEGLILAVKHGKEAGGTFTVRRVSGGFGVERIFPLYSPIIEKIEVVKRSKVRQAKLYHIREKAAKEIKRQMRNVRDIPVVVEEEEVVVEVKEEGESLKAPENKPEEKAQPEKKEDKTEKSKEESPQPKEEKLVETDKTKEATEEKK